MKQINLKLEPALVDTIDSVRGDVPRTVWITRAIEERLDAENYHYTVSPGKPGEGASVKLNGPVTGATAQATSSAPTQALKREVPVLPPGVVKGSEVPVPTRRVSTVLTGGEVSTVEGPCASAQHNIRKAMGGTCPDCHHRFTKAKA